MSDVVDLRWIGRTLREVQAQQRSLNTEQAIMRRLLSDAISALLDRIGNAEALFETRFDRLDQRLDQTERSIEERLDRIERLLTAKP